MDKDGMAEPPKVQPPECRTLKTGDHVLVYGERHQIVGFKDLGSGKKFGVFLITTELIEEEQP